MNERDWLLVAVLVLAALMPLVGAAGVSIGRMQAVDEQKKQAAVARPLSSRRKR